MPFKPTSILFAVFLMTSALAGAEVHFGRACVFLALVKTSPDPEAHLELQNVIFHLRAELKECRRLLEEIDALRLNAMLEKTLSDEGPAQAAYEAKKKSYQDRSAALLKLSKQTEAKTNEDYQHAASEIDAIGIPSMGQEADGVHHANKVREAATALKTAYRKAERAHEKLIAALEVRRRAEADFGKREAGFVNRATNEALDQAKREDLSRLYRLVQDSLDTASTSVVEIKKRMLRREQIAESAANENPQNKSAADRLAAVQRDLARVDAMLGTITGETRIERALSRTVWHLRNEDPFGLPAPPVLTTAEPDTEKGMER